MFDQFTKAFQNTKFPTADASELYSAMQKNTEAFASAAQIMTETAQELTKKAVEYAQQDFEAASKVSRDLMTTKAPEQNSAKQADYAKKAFDENSKRFRAATEQATQAQMKAFDVINKRFAESVKEGSKFSEAA